MNSKNNPKNPYLSLGSELRLLREKNNESLVEVSGAVEIDAIQLERYESGQIRPSEDILLLLISHFNAKDETATNLWQMAGYSEPAEQSDKAASEQINIRHDIVVMPIDPRIIYSDKVQVMVNKYGVVFNFMQSANTNFPSLPISRIGMSKEHAKNLLEVLKNTLEQSDLQNRNLQKKLELPKTGPDETPKK